MRLHRVSIQAFGPFAGRVEIDFDRLSEQGLFLLHGPTGAGKTSILDAICFALYAKVPGARADAKRLRSDHASSGVAPEVVVDFSARGRRFEVTRSPEWDRPKTRGDGQTKEKARTLLREFADGHWLEGTRDHRESQLQITELLGMKVEQFTRVVLLPQGEFATFLRADAADRAKLLQQLFSTERFEAVEDWLIARDAEARDAVDSLHAQWRELAAQAAQTATVLTAADPTAEDGDSGTEGGRVRSDAGESGAEAIVGAEAGGAAIVGAVAAGAEAGGAESDAAVLRERPDSVDPNELRDYLEYLKHRFARRLNSAQLAAAGKEARVKELSNELEALRARSKRAAELDELIEREHRFQDAADARADRDAQLKLHQQAEPLRELLESAERAETSHEDAVQLVGSMQDEAGFDQSPTAEDITSELARLDPEIVRLEDSVAQERDLLARRENLAAERRALAESEALADQQETEFTTLGTTLSQLAEEITQHVPVASRLEACRAAHAAAIQRHDAAAVAASLEADVALLQAKTDELWDKERAAHTAFLDLRAARLDQMASELAAGLQAGCACPVCGSTRHPRKAEPVDGAVTGSDEKRAEKFFSEAQSRHRKVQAELSVAQSKAAEARGRSGDLSCDEASGQRDAAQAELRLAEQATSRVLELHDESDAIEQSRSRLKPEIERRRALIMQHGATLVAAAAGIEQMADKLAGLRGDDESLITRLRRLTLRRTILQKLQSGIWELAHAAAERTKTRQHVARRAAEVGFGSVDEMRASLLSTAETTKLLAGRDADFTLRAELQASRRRPEIALAAEEAPANDELPDLLARTVTEHGSASAALVAARNAVAVLQTAQEALIDKATQLEASIAGGQAVHDRYELNHRLAELARGGTDNALRMSLSSYVLAARLEEVAAAATQRLLVMSDGRYELRYSDSLATRGRKSGLGLEILDGYTGLSRNPKTLSGGESFQASLALALGLADVVKAESGGIDLETLFVDEGFGTLDEQSLEKVMDILDDLRSGGRAVGVISHVAEMRSRVTSQLEVLKTRDGSTLREIQS
ncbi:SMC family ATPase [Saxibacter everestensis]|uniref:Nuclease SbcCD subunit C n=1 Tax=Saxibacter everestensis TaxID=2909229 RepID=A0ABY8QWW0_9MICO|nr:SMC family ATPase [Brevibacteriaceae bacterium ZFBP1038]